MTPARATFHTSKDLQQKVTDVRWLPTRFDADDPELIAFPRDVAWRWRTLEAMLTASSAQGVLLRLPAFWQANFAAFDACRAHGIPLFVNEPENTPLGCAALEGAGLDTLVTTATDAIMFCTYAAEKRVPMPRSVLTVSSPGSSTEFVPAFTAHIRHEVHAIPGLPLLEQCGDLSTKPDSRRFHLSDDFSDTGNGSFATAPTLGPIILTYPFLNTELKRDGLCSCGKEILVRI